MNYKKMAQEILDEVGGPGNIKNMTHCATRLRLTLKDTSIVNDESVKAIDGVVNVVNKAGQYQLLIGTEVPKLYDEFEILAKGDGSHVIEESNESSGNIIRMSFRQFQQFLHHYFQH